MVSLSFLSYFHSVRPRWLWGGCRDELWVGPYLAQFALALSCSSCMAFQRESSGDLFDWLCWFAQFWGMLAPRQDKQTDLGDDDCWRHFTKKTAAWEEGLDFAWKTKAVLKQFVVLYLGRIQMSSDSRQQSSFLFLFFSGTLISDGLLIEWKMWHQQLWT